MPHIMKRRTFCLINAYCSVFSDECQSAEVKQDYDGTNLRVLLLSTSSRCNGAGSTRAQTIRVALLVTVAVVLVVTVFVMVAVGVLVSKVRNFFVHLV